MRKAILISIFCTVILTSCGNVSEPAENVTTSAVSQITTTTTTVTTSASTSAKNDCLEYASNLEFNVGLDGTAIWFLTE